MALRRYRRPLQDPDDIRSKVDRGYGGGQSGGSSFESRSGRGGGGASQPSAAPEGTNYRRPLGVPNDWTTMDPGGFRGMSPRAVEGFGGVNKRAPRYYDGDELRPAGSGFDSIVARQRALVLGGYLAEDFTYGRWDPPTIDAYKTLLEEANAAGLTAEQMLSNAAQGIAINMGGSGEGGGGRGGYTIDPETGELVSLAETFAPPPLEISTTNKADLARVFEGASQNYLGVALPRDQIERMVEAYNWVEIQAQKDAYDQEVERMRQEFVGDVEPGLQTITSVSAPTPETFILDKLREERPEELENYQGMTTLMDMIDSWAAG